jgi:hypothetical protein
MIYGEYSDGAGGRGKVADLAHGFLSFWCPVCNFAGMAESLLGPSVINTGHVSGDYSLNGIQSGAGRFLDSTIQLGAISNNLWSVGHYNNTPFPLDADAVRLFGGRPADSTWNIDYGANQKDVFRFRPGNTTVSTVSGSVSDGLLAMSRLATSGADSVKFFHTNGTVTSINSTAVTTSSTLTFYYGAFNAGGSAVLNTTNRYNAAYILRDLAVDTPQITILRNALGALNTARATL